MANVGHTIIEATGAPQDLAALFAHVRATACDGCAFSLSGLMHPDPVPDQYVYWTELSATDQQVSLSIGVKHDLDALAVAGRLAERFPALRVAAFFVAEGDESAFDAMLYVGGQLAYHAHFEDDVCFPLHATGPDGRCTALVRFFERTPERSAAAPDHIDGTALARLGARPAIAGGWRQAMQHDDVDLAVWWQPGTADGAGQALVLDAGGATLLTGVDRWGGYVRKECLDAGAAAQRLPELAGLIGQHACDRAARRAARRPMTQADDLDDFEIPF